MPARIKLVNRFTNRFSTCTAITIIISSDALRSVLRSKQHRSSSSLFSDHLCQQLLNHGYDFFALDLRKCGRSVISPNHDHYKHYFQDITEYYEEITLSIEHILKEAKGREKKLILYGHSTGTEGHGTERSLTKGFQVD